MIELSSYSRLVMVFGTYLKLIVHLYTMSNLAIVGQNIPIALIVNTINLKRSQRY